MKARVLWILQGYKRAVSPLLPPACRYVPSCSEYAEQAVEMRGVLKGGLLGMWRLLRCHPFAKGGFDPVSQKSFPFPVSSFPSRVSSHRH